jgi:hypothetical protein
MTADRRDRRPTHHIQTSLPVLRRTSAAGVPRPPSLLARPPQPPALATLAAAVARRLVSRPARARSLARLALLAARPRPRPAESHRSHQRAAQGCRRGSHCRRRRARRRPRRDFTYYLICICFPLRPCATRAPARSIVLSRTRLAHYEDASPSLAGGSSPSSAGSPAHPQARC